MKGQSKLVLETILRSNTPLTCQEITHACGYDPTESKNVSAILHNLLARGRIEQTSKRLCVKTGRLSTCYQKIQAKPKESSSETQEIKLMAEGKTIYITIRVA